MHKIGQEEIDAVAKVIRSGKLFRYAGGYCDRFEKNWARKLGVPYAKLCNSGTSALVAGLVGLGIGPGHEVIVPAYTYMATATAVLNAGAIPVVADIDESMTLCPVDTEKKISKYTGAIIPVHMNGLSCDMKAIMKLSRKHKVLVLEDACQAVGGGFEGRRLGSIGHAGGFSFNYFKNISAGEGGAVVTRTRRVFRRASNMIDTCAYYWDEKVDGKAAEHFVGPNYRYTEVNGAILCEQLKRLDGILRTLRREKKAILKACVGCHGLRSMVNHSLDYECATHLGFIFETRKLARAFLDELVKQKVTSGTPFDSGRHVYLAWDPIMRHKGAHHPALDPFRLPANRKLNMRYSKTMCKASLDRLARTVMVATNVNTTKAQLDRKISAIRKAECEKRDSAGHQDGGGYPPGENAARDFFLQVHVSGRGNQPPQNNRDYAPAGLHDAAENGPDSPEARKQKEHRDEPGQREGKRVGPRPGRGFGQKEGQRQTHQAAERVAQTHAEDRGPRKSQVAEPIHQLLNAQVR